jgi:hypothetical protein
VQAPGGHVLPASGGGFDDDPFATLLWRGRSPEALLNRVRELRGGDPVPAEQAALQTESPRPGAMMAWPI